MKEGWKMVKLGEVCEKFGEYGMSVPSKPFDGIRYIRITDITDNGNLNDDYVSANIECVDANYILQEGDVLFARTGATVGKTFVYRREFGKSVYAGYLIRYRPNLSKVIPQYIYYYTHFQEYYDWVKRNQKAAAQPNISAKLYNGYEFPLPPLEEQHRIVGILDAAFAKIDALKANAEANLANAKTLFQQVLAQELQPKEGWVEKKLGEVVKEIFAGGDAPKENMSKTITEHYKIPIFANAVEDDGLYGFTDNARVNEPAITIAARGSGTGHVLRRKGAFLPIVRLIVIIPEDYIGIDYMYYALKNINIRKSGTAIPQLTVPMLREYKILFSTEIDEQHRIVQTLDTLSEKCRRLEQVAQQTICECDALKQSILRQAFSGEL